MKRNLLIIVVVLISITSNAQFGDQQIITDNAVNAYSVVVADIDGDNNMDVLSSSEGNNTIAWYKNLDGLGSFSEKIIVTEDLFNPRAIFAVDIDGDGDMDVLGTSFDSIGLITWYENLDGQGTFGETNLITNQASGAKDVFGADLDGDGDMDILSASRGDNKVAWYKNLDGNGTFSDQIIITNTANTVDTAKAADIDGDGDLDVIYGAGGLDSIAWFENTNGQGDFITEHIVSNDVNGVTSIFIIDLDNDGDKDIVSSTFGDDTIDWFENLDGLGSFGAKQNIDATIYAPLFVFSADLDNDNDNDILAAIAGDNMIVWYENLGNGIFGSQQIISDQTEGARTVFAADLDNDGYKDVLSASIIDYKIAWYKNISYLNVADVALQNIRISPNPVKDVLQISSENEEDIKVVTMYSTLGTKLMVITKNFKQIEVTNLTKGVYFVKIETHKGAVVKKIVKE